MLTNNVPWSEPDNCPRCGCGWNIKITDKSVIVIFCSNPNCAWAWQAQSKTLYDAVKIWNKICKGHSGKDRPNTPLLVEVYSKGKNSVYRTKKKENKEE